MRGFLLGIKRESNKHGGNLRILVGRKRAERVIKLRGARGVIIDFVLFLINDFCGLLLIIVELAPGATFKVTTIFFSVPLLLITDIRNSGNVNTERICWRPHRCLLGILLRVHLIK